MFSELTSYWFDWFSKMLKSEPDDRCGKGVAFSLDYTSEVTQLKTMGLYSHQSWWWQPRSLVCIPWNELALPATCVCECSIAQSCLTLCNPTNGSPTGSLVCGIILARILEQVAISYSRGIFPTQGSNSNLLCLLHWQVELLQLSHLGISDEGPGLCVDIFEVT